MSHQLVQSRSVRFIDFTEEIKRSLTQKQGPKTPRIKLEAWQVESLDAAYNEDTHPSQKTKKNLAEALGLPFKSVQIWFQNKRAKEKSKKEASDSEREESGRESSSSQFFFNNEYMPREFSEPERSSDLPKPQGLCYKGSEKTDCSLMAEIASSPLLSSSMSYDDCYNAISTMVHAQDYSFASDACSEASELFAIATPSSPIMRQYVQAEERASTMDKSPVIMPLVPNSPLADNEGRYRFQFRNRSIIYTRETDRAGFYNLVHTHTSLNE
ncbi:hypothetical protein NEHOM01_0399 [Nematocida homosporus]|uniref:uncharacterized protein n=1 Tax=Nematocida homosporus TaxID=1912981 RepID=UPI0022208F72|nr:uncharacterized protein NEHOM01_0399 [Nematocida homosporus]KAI5184797.1 hypothetical protein NEHOM01_0399 [Nematocida homosporus]